MIDLRRVKHVPLILCLLFAASIGYALESSSRNWHLSAPSQNSILLSIASGLDMPGTVTLSTAGREVFETSFNRGELLGVCVEKNTQSPSFIVTEVMEGVGLEQAYALRRGTTGWGLITLPYVEAVVSLDELELVSCNSSSINWTVNGHAIHCECDFSNALKQQLLENQWHELLSDYQTGLYLNEAAGQLIPRQIADTARVEKLLAKAGTDRAIAFNESVKGRLWRIIEYKHGIYGSISLGMLKQDKHWSVWYYARGNSKSFHAISDIEQPRENILSATLCIEGCDWWGNLARIELGLDTLILRMAE